MTRRFLSCSMAACLLAASLALAVPAAGPDLENARHQYLGVVNANAVLVRSGPSANDYATLRLDKGAQVVITGMKFDWLKIQPPDGSFSYVSKLYVERQGDGNSGRVTKDNLNVWAGSGLTTVKSALQCRLARGAEVQILGEAEEYYKIKPPAEACVWIHQNLVSPLKNLTAQNPAGQTPPVSTDDQNIAAVPTTGPTTAPAVTAAPTTQASEAVAAAENEFDSAEAAYKANEAKPLEQQAILPVLASFEKVLASEALPLSMRRVAEARVPYLKNRQQAHEKLVAVRKAQQEAEARLKAMGAERVELEQKLADNGVAVFTAVGAVQASSLQQGAQTLYRLTDPASGRTVVYVRATDSKVVLQLGQFVGVRGELVTDPRLDVRIVNATEAAVVDPAKVNKGVTAQLLPPSLLIKQNEARTDARQ